jgi:hypothetical protein
MKIDRKRNGKLNFFFLKYSWLNQLIQIYFSSIKEDPALDRHFKGHRDVVTSLDFSPNTKQLGMLL